MAHLRAMLRARVIFRVALVTLAYLAQEVRHFDCAQCRIRTLIASQRVDVCIALSLQCGVLSGPFQSLLRVVGRQYTECDGNSGVQAGSCQTARTFRRDVLEVWRRAANHRTEGDHGVASSALRELLCCNRQIESAGYTRHRNVAVACAVTLERLNGAGEQTTDHEIVKARCDDCEPQIARLRVAFESLN